MSKLVSLIATLGLLAGSAAFAGAAAEHVDSDTSGEHGKMDRTGDHSDSADLERALERLNGGKPGNDNGVAPEGRRAGDSKTTLKLIQGGRDASVEDTRSDATGKEVQDTRSSTDKVGAKTSAVEKSQNSAADSAADVALKVFGEKLVNKASKVQGGGHLISLLAPRVASGELDAETAIGLVEADHAAVELIGRPIINPAIAKECAGMDKEALRNLSKIYSVIVEAAGKGEKLTEKELTERLIDQTAKVFSESRKAAADRLAKIGGYDGLDGTPGAQCLLEDKRIAGIAANEAAAL